MPPEQGGQCGSRSQSCQHQHDSFALLVERLQNVSMTGVDSRGLRRTAVDYRDELKCSGSTL